uniref:Organic cation transporter-like protein 2 n=1 Tax=Geotrypetes seraphini TaxID=260995 RepID=A0A6P8QAZ8_GEOSA|nr:solute carrier family 22 member 18 [Geotrypetes seraphini]XP_033784403.1 solute carrier family 22 member 18 [Geotrypetes seraphini]XP_033784404.1 solute carrier family 22 member 18 [Geotrypetes seraphini]XP_033784405.1 solute carrier family 22 member 18 [Geotrypetes seraphini]
MDEQIIEDSTDDSKRTRSFVIRITYLLLAIDVSCLFTLFATFPYLVRKLGLDTVGFGYLQTIFGILQLLGSPIFGRFSDRFGARAALTLSFLSGSLFYLLLSISTSVPLLFLSRIPSVFMHGLPGAQMVITDLTTPTERGEALGKLGLCFGLGMIAGPFFGGILATKFGIYSPMYAALMGNLLGCVLTRACIPSHIKPKSGSLSPANGTSKSNSVFNVNEIVRLMKFPDVRPIFTIKVISVLPTGFFMVMFPVISINSFDQGAAEAGYVMSYFGVLQMVVQGVLVGWLTRHYTDGTLLLWSVMVASATGIAMALMTTVFHFCIIALPLVFALATLGIITDSILTKAVPPSDTGAMLGICASVQPLIRTVGPTIGGFLYQNYGLSAFGYLNFVVNLVLFCYILKSNIPLKVKKER